MGVPSQHAGADITRANVDGSTLICRHAVNVEATVGRIFSDYDIILFNHDIAFFTSHIVPELERIGFKVKPMFHGGIASGAKIFGNITIADGIVIGANSVVNKSFLEPNITIAGVPAKKISNKGSQDRIINSTEILRKSREPMKK